MPGRRDVRFALARVDKLATLRGLTDEALALQDIKPVFDPETTQEEIRQRVSEQASQILADAETDYADYEAAQALAERDLRRPDYLAWGICGMGTGYILATILLASPRPVYGLTGFVAAAAACAFGIRRRISGLRRNRLLQGLVAARQRWVSALRDNVLLPFILQTLNNLTQDSVLYATQLDPVVPPRLVERSEPRRVVASDAMSRIKAVAESMRDGSLGVSGPRGVGKTTIVRYFCDDAYRVPGSSVLGSSGGTEETAFPLGEPELRVTLAAPVDYQPRDFIIHLFSRLAETVLENVLARQDPARGPAQLGRSIGLPARKDWRRWSLSSFDRQVPMGERSRRLLADLRFLRTYSTGWNASMTTVSALGLSGSRSRQVAEQPFTLPELVARYREYSEDVASWWRSVHNRRGRVLIGIDEVDKILDGERAEAFLNDIKAVFGVPGCLYFVSLSEDALAVFAQRALAIRSALDSAFDELVAVSPMTYRDSEELLVKRIAGLPRPFVALCHVLAGGLPRDLLREARGLTNAADSGKLTALPELASALVRHDLDSLRRASLGRLAACSGTGELLNSLNRQEWPGVDPRHLVAAAAELADGARQNEDEQVRQICRELIVSLSFYAAVLAVFGPLHGRLVTELREGRYGLVDDLARARQAMRLDASLAHVLIDQYLRQNGITLRAAK